MGLALLTVVTGWYPNRGGFNVWFHPWDSFHYYIGGKYFRELGYTRLYECVMVADVEAGHGARVAGTGIRNLETNRIDVTASYDFLISDFLSLTTAYGFSRETWGGEPTDIHRISVDLVLTPLENADVVLGMLIENRPYYTEWSVDVQLVIRMDLL